MNKDLITVLNRAHEIEIALMESAGEVTPQIQDMITIKNIEEKEIVDSYEVIMDRLEIAESYCKNKSQQFAMMARSYGGLRDNMRSGIKSKMLETGRQEITGHDIRFKLSRTQPSLNIVSEDLIEEQYKKQVTTTVVDKDKIKTDLKQGKEVLGAELVENVSLRKYNIGPKQGVIA